jgi:hypothetical protein
VWRLERLHLRRDVNDTQLHDDPDDLVGLERIAALAQALEEGATLPPMIGKGGSGTDSPVLLHDGRHRDNAFLSAGLSLGSRLGCPGLERPPWTADQP